MSKGEQRGWAVVTRLHNSERRYIVLSTIRELRREAIEAYDRWYPERGTYSADRKRWGIDVKRVIVRIADEAER